MLRNKTFWLLVFVCVLTILPFVGFTDFHTKGEPREAVVSYSMIASDNWISPRNNGGDMAYKPPFLHWCIAVVSLVWGEVNEATSRIPSAIALIAMTLAGFAFYARRKGNVIGLVTALVAFTSFELHRAGSNCRVDMMLTALTVGALYCLYSWYERGLRGLPWLGILLMGLATMTKGPVGSVLPCLVMGVFMLLRKENFFKTFGRLLVCGLLSLIIYAVWFYAAWKSSGQEFLNLMFEENIARMTGQMTYESHNQPWPYNFFTIITGYVPWMLLLLISLFTVNYALAKQRVATFCHAEASQKRWKSMWNKLCGGVSCMDSVDLFSLVSIIVIFVFYCIPSSKRSVYLMPLYPFIGYFVAKYVLWMADNKSKAIKIYGGILSVITAILFVVFVIVKLQLVPESVFGSGRHAAQNVDMLHALENCGGVFGWLIVMLTTCVGAYWWKFVNTHAQGKSLVYALIALTLLVYVSLDGVYLPAVLNGKSLKEMSKTIDAVAPASEGTLYEYIHDGVMIKGNPMHFFELNFYLNNRIENFYHRKPSNGFLLISHDEMVKYGADFAKEGYLFQLRSKLPKRDLEVYKFEKNR